MEGHVELVVCVELCSEQVCKEGLFLHFLTSISVLNWMQAATGRQLM